MQLVLRLPQSIPLSRRPPAVGSGYMSPRNPLHSGWVPVDAAKSGDEDEIVCLLTNCDHHCPADIFTEVALIVFIIPFLLLLSLESVVRLAFARVCIL